VAQKLVDGDTGARNAMPAAGKPSAESAVWQFFSDQDQYEPRLPCYATQIGRFRRAIGEEGLEQLLKATSETSAQIKTKRLLASGKASLRP